MNSSREKAPRHRLVGAIVTILALAAVVTPASAHTPSQGGSGAGAWDWTCSQGNGLAQATGACYRHYSYATTGVHFVNLSGTWTTAVPAGKNAWDKTDGHEFNFDRQSTNTSSNSTVTIVTGGACGVPTWAGCAGVAIIPTAPQHSDEGASFIELSSSTPISLRDDVATHEFGHLLGLGHSDKSSATMWPTAATGQVTLNLADRAGRCQVYGHAHSYWGGCL